MRALQVAYATEQLRPSEVIEAVLERLADRGDDAVWISRWSDQKLRQRAVDLDRIRRDRGTAGMPLYGVPCAVKDNIDVAGLATTAGCPAYRYWPDRNASCVQRLIDAGAMVIGKTNMDQFATGLTGTRSPYGVTHSVFGGGLIAGGSSSGSAVAVAAGLVSFALGTDTAGSGRVPAAMNGIVGCKPTRGLVSTAGVVPACRSLDCVSILTAS
ncbi:MAG TPA: amidase family protein, partial [Pseudonocardiaceae bacterium]|nr:amidase family protein [Pseudonocardiaceae bacterium]